MNAVSSASPGSAFQNPASGLKRVNREWRSLERIPQISPLRFAPVEMTSSFRAWNIKVSFVDFATPDLTVTVHYCPERSDLRTEVVAPVMVAARTTTLRLLGNVMVATVLAEFKANLYSYRLKVRLSRWPGPVSR